MRLVVGAWIAILGASACVDGDVDVSEARTPSVLAHAGVVDQMTTADASVCDLLPADSGACSVACDNDALRAYVPVGTCAAFVCDLIDGSQAIFHACHPR